MRYEEYEWNDDSLEEDYEENPELAGFMLGVERANDELDEAWMEE